eukprot:3324921-Rhodomonas_salina.1
MRSEAVRAKLDGPFRDGGGAVGWVVFEHVGERLAPGLDGTRSVDVGPQPAHQRGDAPCGPDGLLHRLRAHREIMQRVRQPPEQRGGVDVWRVWIGTTLACDRFDEDRRRTARTRSLLDRIDVPAVAQVPHSAARLETELSRQRETRLPTAGLACPDAVLGKRTAG